MELKYFQYKDLPEEYKARVAQYIDKQIEIHFKEKTEADKEAAYKGFLLQFSDDTCVYSLEGDDKLFVLQRREIT